jgi:hypothetical protein
MYRLKLHLSTGSCHPPILDERRQSAVVASSEEVDFIEQIRARGLSAPSGRNRAYSLSLMGEAFEDA